MKYSEDEKRILKVVHSGIENAEIAKQNIEESNKILAENISASEKLLIELGYVDHFKEIQAISLPRNKVIKLRTFEELLDEANRKYPEEITIDAILTNTEIEKSNEHINQLSNEFNDIHKLDNIDILISVLAGVLSGSIECTLGGFTKNSLGKNVPGTMSNYIRGLFSKVLTPEKIVEFENLAKVPYDALNYDNRGNIIVEKIVEGLSPLFHHEVSLGHDPILSFIFGVIDMLRGTITTIDFNGNFIIQEAEGFSDRKAQNIFEAIATVFLHFLSDVSGSSTAKKGGMGLPVPFMALFNKLQFGEIGDNKTISELVKSMFYQGYDFRHFCAMSIPVMIIEVVVRVSYFAKRMDEGSTFREAIPVGLNHSRKPKLGTILFISHSASTAINFGKVTFTKSPLNINYAQWLAFARYSIKQLKWVLVDKPEKSHQYVMGVIDGEWEKLYGELDILWDDFLVDGSILFQK